MRSQTLELNLDPNIRYCLYALSHSSTLFYNAALKQREEHPGTLNRTKQMKDASHLYTLAGIDPLPYSVAYQLLLELDVVTYTPARFQERTFDRFHALTWSGDNIEIDNYGILLQPDIRLPLPAFSDPSGILMRIRVRTIVNDLIIVNFQWRPIPANAGPGSDLKRAFGYKLSRGALESYVLRLVERFASKRTSW